MAGEAEYDVIYRATADFSDLSAKAAEAKAQMDALRASSDDLNTSAASNSDIQARTTAMNEAIKAAQDYTTAQKTLNQQLNDGFTSPQDAYNFRQQQIAQLTAYNKALNDGNGSSSGALADIKNETSAIQAQNSAREAAVSTLNDLAKAQNDANAAQSAASRVSASSTSSPSVSTPSQSSETQDFVTKLSVDDSAAEAQLAKFRGEADDATRTETMKIDVDDSSAESRLAAVSDAFAAFFKSTNATTGADASIREILFGVDVDTDDAETAFAKVLQEVGLVQQATAKPLSVDLDQSSFDKAGAAWAAERDAIAAFDSDLMNLGTPLDDTERRMSAMSDAAVAFGKNMSNSDFAAADFAASLKDVSLSTDDVGNSAVKSTGFFKDFGNTADSLTKSMKDASDAAVKAGKDSGDAATDADKAWAEFKVTLDSVSDSFSKMSDSNSGGGIGGVLASVTSAGGSFVSAITASIPALTSFSGVLLGLVTIFPVVITGLLALGTGFTGLLAVLGSMAPALGAVLPIMAGLAAAAGVGYLAFKTLDTAFTDFNSHSADFNKFSQPIQQLVKDFSSLEKAFDPILKDGPLFATDFAEGVNPAMAGFTATIKPLSTVLPAIATVLGQLVGQALSAWTALSKAGDLQTIFNGFKTTLANVGEAFISIFDAMTRLAAAGQPITDLLTGGFRNLTNELDEFIKDAQTNGTLTTFFSTMASNLKLMGNIFSDTFSGINHLFTAFMPVGEAFLEFIDGVAEKFKTATSNGTALNAWAAAAIPALQAFGTAIMDVVEGLISIGSNTKVLNDITTILQALDTVIPPVVTTIKDLFNIVALLFPAIASVFKDLAEAFADVLNFLDPLIQKIMASQTGFDIVKGLLFGLAGIVVSAQLTSWIGNMIKLASTSWDNLIKLLNLLPGVNIGGSSKGGGSSSDGGSGAADASAEMQDKAAETQQTAAATNLEAAQLNAKTFAEGGAAQLGEGLAGKGAGGIAGEAEEGAAVLGPATAMSGEEKSAQAMQDAALAFNGKQALTGTLEKDAPAAKGASGAVKGAVGAAEDTAEGGPGVLAKLGTGIAGVATSGAVVGTLGAGLGLGAGILGNKLVDDHTKAGSTTQAVAKEGVDVASGAATGAALGSVVPGVGTAIGGAVGAAAGGIYGFLQNPKQLTDAAMSVLKKFGDDIESDVIKPVTAEFKSLWNDASSGAKDAWNGIDKYIVDPIKTAFDDVKNAITGGFDGWWKSHGDEVKQVWNDIWHVAETDFKAAVEVITSVAKGIYDAVDGAWKLVENIFKSSPVQNTFKAMWDTISSIVKVAMDLIEGVIKAGWDVISTIFKVVFSAIEATIKVTWDVIVGIFSVALDLLTGHWGKAWDDIKTAAEQVWNAIYGFFKSAWNDFVDMFESIWKTIASTASSVWKDILSGLKSVWSDIKNAAESAWNDFVSWIEGLWKDIVDFAKSEWAGLKIIFDTVWSDIKNAAKTAWDDFTSWIEGIWNDITSWFKGEFDKFVSGFKQLWSDVKSDATTAWNDFVTWIEGIWNDIASWFTTQWDKFKSGIGQLWSDIKSDASTAWNDFVTWIEGIWNDISSWFTDQWNKFKSGIGQLWSDIKSDATTAWNDFVTWIEGIWNDIASWFTDQWSKFKSGIGQLWSDIKSDATTAWNDFVSWIEGIWNTISSWFIDQWNKFESGIKQLWSDVKSDATTAWNDFTSWIEGIWNTISSWFTTQWGNFKTDIKNLWGDIKTDATTAWNDLHDFITGVATKIWNDVKATFTNLETDVKKIFSDIYNDGVLKAVDAIIDVINAVIKGVNDVASVVGITNALGSGITKPSPETFADGGVVPDIGTGTVGDTVPAMLTVGEGVLTTSEMKKLGGASGFQALRNQLQYFAAGGIAEATPKTTTPTTPTNPSIQQQEQQNQANKNLANSLLNQAGNENPVAALSTDVAGLIKEGIDGLKDVALSAADDVFKGVIDPLVALIPDSSGFGKYMKAAAQKLEDDVSTFISGKAAAAAKIPTPENVPGNVTSWISQGMAIAGVSGADWTNGLTSIAMNESGGNPNAVNNYDSNAQAGHPSAGLMQFIQPTFDAYAKPGYTDWMNPIDQVVADAWSGGYIDRAYGGIDNVPGLKSLSGGGGYVGYAQGGIVQPQFDLGDTRNTYRMPIPDTRMVSEAASQVNTHTGTTIGDINIHNPVPTNAPESVTKALVRSRVHGGR